MKLDENQQKAVEHFEGPALVVAGPGSGKTTVIKERILHLINEHNVDPRQILALAFNKEASKEMEKRILSEVVLKSKLPEIRTLHAFGLRIINQHYNRLKQQNKPEVWSSDPERTIRDEIQQLKKNMANTTVTIYKIENELTGKCYIGQTTNPERRKREHFSFDDSSNSDLRQTMLSEGKEHFKFCRIDTVEGKFANKREAEYIEYYRNRAVLNLLEPEVEQPESDTPATHISIYKIENKKTGICYIVQSTDSERSKIDDFTDSSNDVIRKAIKIEGIEQFTFEALHTEVPNATAPIFVESAIQDASSRSRAVFNRNNPLNQRYSNQLMIELFCEHFNIRYEELLKCPSSIENLMQKIEDFEKIVDQVQKIKRQVVINFSKDASIDDIVNSIIQSIDDRIVRAFAEKYEKKKKKANAIDFQDMILYAVYLLETCPDVRARCHEKYDYVLIDEFQDVSPIDFRLIKPLSENLFAVGDDDQAIYGFRGGDSEIMQKFSKQEDVTQYKITRNYRSTSAIVKHSSAMIKHNNPNRISKNLLPENPATRPPIKVLETTAETIKIVFLREFAEPFRQTQLIDNYIPTIETPLLKIHVKTKLQNIGILLRYRSEVESIRKILLDRGFREEKLTRQEGDPFKIIGRSTQEIIEGITIHKAKGKEYNKVILIHNTLGEDFPFHDSDDITEDRRVFYVAMTRARQELVILGGRCQFVPETGLSTLISKQKRQLESVSKSLRFAILKRIDTDKKHVEVFYERIQRALTRALMKQAVDAIKAAYKQNKLELERLRSDITQTENATAELESNLPIALRVTNENLLEDLIPVLDEFESQINNVTKTVKVDNLPTDVAELHQSLQHTQQQLLDSLNNHGLKPIDARGKIFNPDHHEEIQPALYSDDVPADIVLKEKRRGYVLHDQIIRKTRVILSEGENIRIPEQLDRLTEIYLDRLISRFHANFQLTNINKSFIIRKMVQYLSGLDDGPVEKLRSFAVKGVETIGRGRFADYCVSPEKTHLCTDIVFRDFWRQMWEVVEKSRKIPESRIKQTQPSIDGSAFVDANQKNTLDEPQEKTGDFSPKTPTDGEIVKGVVVAVNRDKVMINIGFKSEGYIPASEFDTVENDLPAVQIGDEIDVYIVRREDAEGQIVLSKKIADQTLIWDEIATAHETVTPVKGRITEQIKGGLRVTIGSLRGFLPASQIELRSTQNLEQYVGQTLDMIVISLSKQQHNIVLSRRMCLEMELTQKRSEVLSTLEVGQLVKGVVKNITAFGAFVDLGGVDGLLHKSEMVWKRISHPSEIVSIGEDIEVKVIEFDQKNEKISLSLKQLTSDPWENAEEKYPIGSTILGIVVNVVNYGAFVQLEEGIDGLIHISEMLTESRDTLPLDIVNRGDEVEVIVIRISKDSRRISLRMITNLSTSFGDSQSDPTSDIPVPTEKIKGPISGDPPELITHTPIEDMEDTLPVPEKPSFDEETNSTTPCEPINPIDIQPIEETVDISPPMSEKFSEILNSQIQNLKPEMPETETSSKSPKIANDNSDTTLQKSKEILKAQIQNLKPAPIENTDLPIEIVNNVSNRPTEPTYSEPPEKTNNNPSNIDISHEEKLSKNEIQEKQKNFRYYLRKFGRLVLRKSKLQ